MHGLQGVTFLDREPGGTPEADASCSSSGGGGGSGTQQPQQAAGPAPRKFAPRERAVPSSALGRVAGFAGLGASLLMGAARESVSRAWAGNGAAATAAPGGVMLSEANAERLASALCRMRGAALKLGQMLSIQDEEVLPPQFQAALERVRAGADVMPRRQLDQASTRRRPCRPAGLACACLRAAARGGRSTGAGAQRSEPGSRATCPPALPRPPAGPGL